MNITINEGEIRCSDCRGNGVISVKIGPGNRIRSSLCDKCQGEGKLDWVENIVGKKSDIVKMDSMDLVCEYNEPDVRKKSMEAWEMKQDHINRVVNKIIRDIE